MYNAYGIHIVNLGELRAAVRTFARLNVNDNTSEVSDDDDRSSCSSTVYVSAPWAATAADSAPDAPDTAHRSAPENASVISTTTRSSRAAAGKYATAVLIPDSIRRSLDLTPDGPADPQQWPTSPARARPVTPITVTLTAAKDTVVIGIPEPAHAGNGITTHDQVYLMADKDVEIEPPAAAATPTKHSRGCIAWVVVLVLMGLACAAGLGVGLYFAAKRESAKKVTTAAMSDSSATALANLPGFLSVTAGDSHACGILADSRKLLCWGANSLGQINLPATLTDASWSSVNAGAFHTCAIMNDSHKLVCWGLDTDNQVSIPGKLSNASWSLVAGGKAHTCGLIKDKDELQCWGLDLGRPYVRPKTKWEALAAGGFHTCGITSGKSSMQCWGDSDAGQIEVPEEHVNSKWKGVSAGSFHSCGILRDSNGLRCWGWNTDGQTAVPKNVSEWSAVAAGDVHTCGIAKDTSRLFCWGSGGQAVVPADLVTAKWSAVAVGSAFTCGILADSKALRCWGSNARGQLIVLRNRGP